MRNELTNVVYIQGMFEIFDYIRRENNQKGFSCDDPTDELTVI